MLWCPSSRRLVLVVKKTTHDDDDNHAWDEQSGAAALPLYVLLPKTTIGSLAVPLPRHRCLPHQLLLLCRALSMSKTRSPEIPLSTTTGYVYAARAPQKLLGMASRR